MKVKGNMTEETLDCEMIRLLLFMEGRMEGREAEREKEEGRELHKQWVNSSPPTTDII